jgi:photosystem II stability/assembly factor-like uncharacterized protein
LGRPTFPSGDAMLSVRRSVFFFLLFTVISSFAQQVDSSMYQDLRWRLVGPFRAGRSLTAVGVPGDSHLFYFGSVGGGVWKSTDAGTSWQPIFDGQPIASIGAMAVAPSDPKVIYVGSGEADMRSDISYGNGMYKSSDAGKTWQHIGLEDSHQIGKVLVDPHDANLVYVAALGHAYAANPERGVFRSVNGGKTWQRVLHPNDDTGAIDLAFDPQDSRIVYASLWQTRRAPWNVYPPSNGPGSGLYKSIDGGSTWQRLSGGLPTEGFGRIGIAVAPTDRNRVYAIIDAKDGGLYRSDDAGATWTKADGEQRIWGRGWYFGQVAVDPKNEDIVYVANTQTYRSTDGGHSFSGFKGAPGGDDYHSIWIAPEDPNRIILSSDQGTIVSLNGGATWSSWYNQPTAQLYHVTADNRNPYWLYGAQQDSGAIASPSRSVDYSSISFRDEHPIAVGGESGMLAPDPLDSNIVYGGNVERFDWRTQQTQNIAPSISRFGPFRQTWTLPLVFSAADPKRLYFSHQVLFETRDGGKTWAQISPDLTREAPGVPANLDPNTAKYGLDSPRKGVIYSLAPSPLDANTVWAGTDDGLIHITHDDGKTWKNVTPSALTPWSKVGILEASHFDPQTAYAAIDRHRLDDRHAYIYRTRDGGATWQQVARGIPDGAFVNAVREDSKQKGLLFAGTELGAYISLNDGDDWQSLQLNLPVASIRDFVVHGDDLAVATHGRSFWILDNITPLRQLVTTKPNTDLVLFKPASATRIRPSNDQGTPIPPEIAHADNPTPGAAIDYYLREDLSSPLTLELHDARGKLVRRYSTDDKITAIDEKNLEWPLYWVKPPQVLSNKKGMHRFYWDLHHTSPVPGPVSRRGGGGVWVLPGTYQVKLTGANQTVTQALTITMDPRVKISDADLRLQFEASTRSASEVKKVATIAAAAADLEKQLMAAEKSATGDQLASLKQFHKKFTEIAGPASEGFGRPVTPLETDHTSIRYFAGDLRKVMTALQSADAAPTPEQLQALNNDSSLVAKAIAQWNALLANDLPAVNAKLKSAGAAELKATKPELPPESDDEDR